MTRFFFVLFGALIICILFTGDVFVQVFFRVNSIGLESARTIYLSLITFWVCLASMLYIARWIWDNIPETTENVAEEEESSQDI